MALACLIALGALVFILYTIFTNVMAPTAGADTTTSVYTGPPGTVATLVTPTTAAPATTTTTGKGKGSILTRPSAATGSSSLKATNLTDFRPTNLLDGDPVTAWVEGGKGTGAGEWVLLEFDHAIALDRIEIANGYQKDEAFFADYIRVKTIEVGYSDGTRQVVELQEEDGLQVIEPAVTEAQSIKLTILSVYPDYKFASAALSDVRIYEVVQ